MVIRFVLVFLLTSCIAPDTQPVIDATLAVTELAAADAAQHRAMVELASFDTPADQQAYLAVLDARSRHTETLLTELLDWARKVGTFDQAYLDASLERALQIYLEIRAK